MDDKNENTCNEKNIFNQQVAILYTLEPKQLALLAVLIAIGLTEGLDLNLQNSLGNFLLTVGQTILCMAAQGETLKNLTSKEEALEYTNEDFANMNKQIELLNKKFENLDTTLKGK